MAKVLVTGATGFIGGHVVNELLRLKHEVIASSSNQKKAEKKEWFSSVTYIPFQIADVEANLNLFNFFGEPDVLIHLAWEGLPNYKSDFHILANLPRHQNFLKNLVLNGLKSLCVTGTCFEYGMREGQLSEDMEAIPANSYAAAKNMLRKFLETLCFENSAKFNWLRLFYMYGEGQNEKSLISQLDKAIQENNPIFNMSGGQQIRDYLPIVKVAEYIVITAIDGGSAGIVNCCSGKPVKVVDFVKEYIGNVGRAIFLNLGHYPYPDYEPMVFWGDNTKLLNIIRNSKKV